MFIKAARHEGERSMLLYLLIISLTFNILGFITTLIILWYAIG